MKNKKIIYIVLIILAILILFFAYKENSYKPIEGIKEFYYSYEEGDIGEAREAYYNIKCSNSKCSGEIKQGYDDKKEISVDEKTINKLSEILNDYRVASWKNNDMEMCSGCDDYKLDVITKDNRKLKSYGFVTYDWDHKKHVKFKEDLKELFG